MKPQPTYAGEVSVRVTRQEASSTLRHWRKRCASIRRYRRSDGSAYVIVHEQDDASFTLLVSK